MPRDMLLWILLRNGMARIRELAKKAPKFILSNALGTVVDTAVLWLFLSMYLRAISVNMSFLL